MRMLVTLALLLAAAPALADSASCAFTAGALPADTLPPGTPHGSQIPIDHIVVLMQENRSFDHYFGQLHRAGQHKTEAEPATGNPNPLGGAVIKPFHQKAACEVADLDHSWNGTHDEWNGGLMDGFTAANVDPADPNGHRTMGFYTRHELPFYYGLYKNFAIGDRYFASALTQTFPNRFFLLAGTSFGHIRNDFFSGSAEFSQRTIFEELDAAGVTWKIYNSGLPFGFLFAYVRAHSGNAVPIAQFASDAQNSMLPQVAFVDPLFIGAKNIENDEHPPSNVQVGQQFVASVLGAFVASPQYSSSALFLTYDEHGGFYDHVPPPTACVPDGIPPMLHPGDVVAEFDHLGIRVPVVVVSPFAKRKFVSHVEHDHTSILRFIETRFDLPALTRRDANADPMLEFFDFVPKPHARPIKLPKPPKIDPNLKAQCDALPGVPNDDL